MSETILTSLIALTGVIVSIISSMIINSRQSKTELKRLRSEMERSYAGKLLEKRIECYPILYQALSGLDKSIRFGNLTKKDVEELLKAVLNWDTQYAIFMSTESGSRLHQFRMHLNKLSKMEEKAFNQKFSSNDERLDLLHKANRIEIAIKNDLGIYAVETSNDEKAYDSYKELNQARER